jgi:hypothetical protein
MRSLALLTFLLILLISCEDNDVNRNADFPLGTYTGQFIRSSPYRRTAASNVALSFTADEFSGNSDNTKYPAICKGTYKITGQEIEFTNNCAWTADFDWSYILNGKFEITVNETQLEMTRFSNGQTDRYQLKLQ